MICLIALGAEDSVAWRYFETAEQAVEQLHQDGYFVWSVEQCEGSTKLQELSLCLVERMVSRVMSMMRQMSRSSKPIS